MLLSPSHALTFLVLSHLLPTLSFFYHVFPTSCFFSSSLPLCPFDDVLLQHATPKKTLNPDFVFADKTGPGLVNFTKTKFMGKSSFMLPSANKILENPVVKVSEKHYFTEH